MEADPSKASALEYAFKHYSNELSSQSKLQKSIRKHIPTFTMDYAVDSSSSNNRW